MSVGFLYYLAPVENQNGISLTEIYVAIFLGGIVAAIAIIYEFYTNKNKSSVTNSNLSQTLETKTTISDEDSESGFDKKTRSKDTKES